MKKVILLIGVVALLSWSEITTPFKPTIEYRDAIVSYCAMYIKRAENNVNPNKVMQKCYICIDRHADHESEISND